MNNHNKKLISLIFIFLALVGIMPVYGQLNVSETNSLTFGIMFPGVPKTISKYTPGAAAEFLVQGTAGSELTIDFSLQTYMSSGADNIQLVFQETDCSMDSSASYDQTDPGEDNLDPWHQMTYRLGSAGLRIWLGGMAIPRIRQTQGSYTATIVVTVAYTDN